MPRPLSAAPAVIGSRPPARAGPATTLEGAPPAGDPPLEGAPPAGNPPDGIGPPSLPTDVCGAGPPPAGPALEGPMSPANAGTARPTNRPPARANVPTARRICIVFARLLEFWCKLHQY